MKTFLTPLVAAFLACGLLVGCAGFGIDPTKPPLEDTLKDERTLYVAEAAYNGVLTSISAAIDLGVIQPGSPKAQSISRELGRAKGYLDQARAAQRLGNQASTISLAQQALMIVAGLQAGLTQQGAVQ